MDSACSRPERKIASTEITMLVGPADVDVPTFDTTALHALAAADWALSEAMEPV
jgi:aspartate/glutamate racemase